MQDRRIPGRGMRAACLLLTVLGCSGDDEPVDGLERLELVDQSALCLRSSADGALSVQAIGMRCFSSSCTTVLSASCRFDQRDDEITVQSSIEVERSVGADVICTADCLKITADCAPLQPEAGEYTFRHGEASASVSLPAARLVLFADSGMGEAWCGDPLEETSPP